MTTLQRRIINNAILRKALDNMSDRPSKIIWQELSDKDSSHINLTSYNVKRIRNNISLTRRSSFLALPKSVDEFYDALDALNLLTHKREQFVQLNCKKYNIVCFATDHNIRFLSHGSEILMDGIFYCCPKFFMQLFTIHGLRENMYIPLAFFLLPNKNTASYEMVLHTLKNKSEDLHLVLQPDTIRVDFELSIHIAIRTTLPNAIIVECRFYLGQNLWKKIQKTWLKQCTYNIKRNREFLKILFWTSFLGSK